MTYALVVEDEVMIRELLCEELIDAGLQTIACASGEEALAIIQDNPAIDVLITDIRLNGPLSGWDLGLHVRTRNPELAVIYMSGSGHPDHTLSPRERRIAKPFYAAGVIALLRELGFDLA